jgi:hypothetical protein
MPDLSLVIRIMIVMSPTLNTIEYDIARERAELDAWLGDTYAGTNNERYHGEIDIDYDNWRAIESIAGSVFNYQLTQQLSKVSIDSLLFFISRSDECGRIIAWLSPKTGSPFSWCGNLSYSDFLFLSEQALDRDDDYCDYQLAACYRKCELLDDRAIDILKRFFHKHDLYTRRMSLHAFEHFALPQTVDLAKILWKTDECEFSKLSCLYALKAFPHARPLFNAYLHEYKNTFDINAEEYRRSHMRALTAINAT